MMTRSRGGLAGTRAGSTPADDEHIPEYIYDKHIEYMRHENDLMNQRTTWFIAIQSALMAAFGYIGINYFETLYNGLAGKPDNIWPHYLEFLISWIIVSASGSFYSYCAQKSLRAAIKAQNRIKSSWNNFTTESGFGDSVICKFVPGLAGGGDDTARLDGNFFAKWLTVSATWFWVLVLMAALYSTIMLSSSHATFELPAKAPDDPQKAEYLQPAQNSAVTTTYQPAR